MNRDDLRALVESLPDEMVPEAISLLRHIEDDEPLSPEELADMASALKDIQEQRTISLDEFEHQRGV